jgi:hypothetical protein
MQLEYFTVNWQLECTKNEDTLRQEMFVLEGKVLKRVPRKFKLEATCILDISDSLM